MRNYTADEAINLQTVYIESNEADTIVISNGKDHACVFACPKSRCELFGRSLVDEVVGMPGTERRGSRGEGHRADPVPNIARTRAIREIGTLHTIVSCVLAQVAHQRCRSRNRTAGRTRPVAKIAITLDARCTLSPIANWPVVATLLRNDTSPSLLPLYSDNNVDRLFARECTRD